MKSIVYSVLFVLLISCALFGQTMHVNKSDGSTVDIPLGDITSITFGSSSGIDPLITDGLLHFYPFAGNANDEWGSNHGTVDGADLTSDRKGNPNSAYEFNDGDEDKIVLATHLPDSTQLSISIWVYYTRVSNQVAVVICDEDSEPGNNFRLDVRNTGVGIVANKSGGLVNMPNGNAAPGLTLQNGWHHIVWTMGQTESKIYVDGVLAGTVSKSGSNVGYHYGHAVIGVEYDGVSSVNPFDGKLDDIRIYNRVLTPGEVTTLYNE